MAPPNVPRLGMGYRGGRAALPPSITDLPGAGLGSIPRLGATLPRSNPAPLGLPSYSGGLSEQPTEPNSMNKALRLAQASDILQRVRSHTLEPTRAQKLLDHLLADDSERKDLTRAVLRRQATAGGDVRPELQALKFSPTGKDPGHQTQTYEGAGGGVGTNLVRDIAQTVVGLPAGVGLAGKAVGTDVVDIFRHPMKPHFKHTEREILKPIAKSYAYTYGPLAHGNVGEFGSRVEEHPLGPILDLAAVASAGVGGVARGTAAASAIRAGRLARIGTPEEALAARNAALAVKKNLIRPDAPHPTTGVPMSFYKRPTVEELAAEPYKGHLSGFYNPKNGKIVVGHVGSSHDDLMEALIDNGHFDFVDELERAHDAPGEHNWRPYTAIIDPDTGKIGAVNFWEPVDDMRAATPPTGGRVIVPPEELAKNPWKSRMPGFYDRTTGKVHLGKPGDHHDDIPGDIPALDEAMTDPAASKPLNIYELNVHLDPKTGRIANITVDKPIKDSMGYWDNIGPATEEEAAPVREAVHQELSQSAGFPKTIKVDLDPNNYFGGAPGEHVLDATIHRPGLYTVGRISRESKGGEAWEDTIRGVVNYRTGEAIFGGPEVDGHYQLWDVLKHVHPDPEEHEDWASVFINRDPQSGEHLIVPTLEGEGWERFGFDFDKYGYEGGPKFKEFERELDKKGRKALEEVLGDQTKATPAAEGVIPGWKQASDIPAMHKRRAKNLIENQLWSPEREVTKARSRVPSPKTVEIGPDHSVHLGAKGWEVREQGRIKLQNLPDEASAIKAAQLDSSGYAGSDLHRGVRAALNPGPVRGGLIDLYEGKKKIIHDKEIKAYMEEVAGVLDDPDLRLKRRNFQEVLDQVKADVKTTRAHGKAKPADMVANLPGFISPNAGRVLSTGGTALREASDLIRAGAIYLRPAYLVNNWAGNAFMNLVQQGAFAPVNLAKSLVLDKHLGKRYLAALDQVMGQNSTQVITAGRGRGYVASLTDPVARTMGAVADQPFRRSAFLHEARRHGYGKISEVRTLFDKASGGDEAALGQIATIGRRAQEEIVKFGHMNDMERSVLRNLVFVYSWIRGAARYAGRFPLQHPIQAASYQALSQNVGQPYLRKNLGGVPSYLVGAVPVGRDKNGDPILINPFALNPLGTGLDLMRAGIGTSKVLRDPGSFDKYSQTDIEDLLNPLVKSYLEAREGGRPIADASEHSIAAVRLAHELQHPGSGNLYPTSRKEALGRFTVGSLYPRKASQEAITRSLERERQNDPLAALPDQIKRYEKASGEKLPPNFIGAIKGDIEAIQLQKNFQHDYAKSKGSQGFRNLPPINRAKAAIEFLEKYHRVPKSDVRDFNQMVKETNNDAAMNELANTLWGLTGTGEIRRTWLGMLRDAAGLTKDMREERK
jgi:hypothetical protein